MENFDGGCKSDELTACSIRRTCSNTPRGGRSGDHKNMNHQSECPLENQLSLRLVLVWSKRRIAIASLFVLMRSLAIGAMYPSFERGSGRYQPSMDHCKLYSNCWTFHYSDDCHSHGIEGWRELGLAGA